MIEVEKVRQEQISVVKKIQIEELYFSFLKISNQINEITNVKEGKNKK